MKVVNKIPGSDVTPELNIRKIELKNVVRGVEDTDIIVEVMPFNHRNNEHVEFAFNYSDMLCNAPSPFKDVNDASRRYVELFMVHKADDATIPMSNFSCVYNDLRAARTLFHDLTFQAELGRFFENA